MGKWEFIKICKIVYLWQLHSLLSSILLFNISLSKYYAKFQPQGSYNLGSFMRVSIVHVMILQLILNLCLPKQVQISSSLTSLQWFLRYWRTLLHDRGSASGNPLNKTKPNKILTFCWQEPWQRSGFGNLQFASTVK